MNQPITVHDVIKQRNMARMEAHSLRRERDQLQMLCQVAAHYIAYLPTRKEDSDQEIIDRLTAAAKGDMDVANGLQAGPARSAGPPEANGGPPKADAQSASVQGDRDAAAAPDPGEGGRTEKDVTLTAVEKKVLKAMGDAGRIVTYAFLAPAANLPRHKVISAIHTLDRFGLVERAEEGWRRT